MEVVSGSVGHKAKEIFVCPLCKVENRGTAKFCRRCGKTRVELEALAKSEIAAACASLVPEAFSVADKNVSSSAAKPGSPPATDSAADAATQAAVADAATDRAADAPTPGAVADAAIDAVADKKEVVTFVYAGPAPLKAEDDERQSSSIGNRDARTREGDAMPGSGAEQNSGASRPEEAAGTAPAYIPPECSCCHSGLRSTDKFCSWCGEPQPNRYYPHLKVCPGCDQRLPHRANYCFACGRDVGVHPRLAMRVPSELFKEEDSEFFPTFEA